MQLYWATTEDHCGDWFIVASSAKEVAQLHEYLEGCDDGEAAAELVLIISENVPVETGWPKEELLESLGSTLINYGSARVVEISGRRFYEGVLESMIRSLADDVFESLGEGRINDTTRELKH